MLVEFIPGGVTAWNPAPSGIMLCVGVSWVEETGTGTSIGIVSWLWPPVPGVDVSLMFAFLLLVVLVVVVDGVTL